MPCCFQVKVGSPAASWAALNRIDLAHCCRALESARRSRGLSAVGGAVILSPNMSGIVREVFLLPRSCCRMVALKSPTTRSTRSAGPGRFANHSARAAGVREAGAYTAPMRVTTASRSSSRIKTLPPARTVSSRIENCLVVMQTNPPAFCPASLGKMYALRYGPQLAVSRSVSYSLSWASMMIQMSTAWSATTVRRVPNFRKKAPPAFHSNTLI